MAQHLSNIFFHGEFKSRTPSRAKTPNRSTTLSLCSLTPHRVYFLVLPLFPQEHNKHRALIDAPSHETRFTPNRDKVNEGLKTSVDPLGFFFHAEGRPKTFNCTRGKSGKKRGEEEPSQISHLFPPTHSFVLVAFSMSDIVMRTLRLRSSHFSPLELARSTKSH